MNKTIPQFELIAHFTQLADTGDYDGYYEITNGKVSIFTDDDADESLELVVKTLNDSGCKFYMNDTAEIEVKILEEHIKRLNFMINNGLGWNDMVSDISSMHEI